jgi:hypothetical protein
MHLLDFMELSSQKYAILPYPEPVEFIQHNHTTYISEPFQY